MPVTVIVFAGPPCGGKSTLSRLLATQLQLPRIEMDAVRLELMPNGQNSLRERDFSYRVMHRRAAELLSGGFSVILDATYGRRPVREALETTGRECGALLHLVECSVTPVVAAARWGGRPSGHAAVDLTPALVGSMAQTYRYSELGLKLDSSEPPTRLLESVLHHLATTAPLPCDGRWSAQVAGEDGKVSGLGPERSLRSMTSRDI